MTPHQFVQHWKSVTLSERAACQSHFIALCDLLGVPPPVTADPTGEWFAFEKGLTTTSGGQGFADVWRKGHFGWEYKKKRAKLNLAYEQLLKYGEALHNPPLLIVCDMDRFEIHTNWPNTVKKVYGFGSERLTDPKHLAILKSAFLSPDDLKPGVTQEQVTEQIAAQFAKLADGLHGRGVPPDRAAHFLVRLIFCMFAEDIGLLPVSTFTRTVEAARTPAALSAMLRDLFAKMATGGHFGTTRIAYFNGGLFTDAEVFDLTAAEVADLRACAEYDWAHIEPSIFGALFERSLDPAKRSQLGAYYTSKEDIEAVLRPVLELPLQRELDTAKEKMVVLWERVQAEVQKPGAKAGRGASGKAKQAFQDAVYAFRERLWGVTVLDPACGSGNFLYLALKILLELEKDLWEYASARGVTWLPHVRPVQVRGMEVNPYARELSQVVVWIGYLQWVKFNGFGFPEEPVLGRMDEIRERDAILDLTDPANPREPEWPDAEFIVGNPPFLGGKMLRARLGDEFVEALFRVYRDRVEAQADLCCYWFEKARAMIASGHASRAGLLATQGIRGGASRETLHRIKETGDIFFAVADRAWVLDGADVHISMVGFDGGEETRRLLDGKAVAAINPNLTANADVTRTRPLPANLRVAFMGDTKNGPFDIPSATALALLHGVNVNGRPSSDVVTPWSNTNTFTKLRADPWVIDFGVGRPEREAAAYDSVFEHFRKQAEEARENSRSAVKSWWLHERPRPELRRKLATLPRFAVTPTTGKHRVFAWMCAPTLPDHQLIAFARSDDYFFGVIHSRVHEVWARAQGTQLREKESGFRYTPTTCFETFSFPEPFMTLEAQIGAAARVLDTLRNRWLNPTEWTKQEVMKFPGSMDGPWRRFIAAEDIEPGIGTVRYPRVVPKDAICAAKLKARTLTNLYNERPAWLDAAHRKLDDLVLSAYGWKADISDDDLLTKLLELNLAGRSGLTAEQAPDQEVAPVGEVI